MSGHPNQEQVNPGDMETRVRKLMVDLEEDARTIRRLCSCYDCVKAEEARQKKSLALLLILKAYFGKLDSEMRRDRL